MHEHITSLIINIISNDNASWKIVKLGHVWYASGKWLILYSAQYELGTASSQVEWSCSMSCAVFDPGAAHISKTWSSIP